VVSQPDSGQTEAINKGLRSVGGEIVGYLNSDDVLASDRNRIGRCTLQGKPPRATSVYGDADYIDENDVVTGEYRTAGLFVRAADGGLLYLPTSGVLARVDSRYGRFL